MLGRECVWGLLQLLWWRRLQLERRKPPLGHRSWGLQFLPCYGVHALQIILSLAFLSHPFRYYSPGFFAPLPYQQSCWCQVQRASLVMAHGIGRCLVRPHSVPCHLTNTSRNGGDRPSEFGCQKLLPIVEGGGFEVVCRLPGQVWGGKGEVTVYQVQCQGSGLA